MELSRTAVRTALHRRYTDVPRDVVRADQEHHDNYRANDHTCNLKTAHYGVPPCAWILYSAISLQSGTSHCERGLLREIHVPRPVFPDVIVGKIRLVRLAVDHLL